MTRHSIRVDPEARTARAEAGATWGDFDAETQAFGLAVTGGRFSTTGIAGLTLGSGSGWLERKCGLTPDNLIEADVGTADGRLITANAETNADLFWGLRGGGGNFGVVTSFVYRLHEVGPIVYGGLLACSPERAGEILRFLREYMPGAPDDLGGAAAFVSAPPEPHVPAEMHFAPIMGIVICWTGPMEDGERAVAPIRELAQPLMDMVGPMPYAALQSMLDGGGPPTRPTSRGATELAEDMAPHTTTGVYLNFTSDTGDERVRSSFGPDKYARLVALKDKYDPANMFRLNANIRPSATVTGPA